MIIEPKWSLRPGDWDLSAFSIISILVGAIPSNSLLVSMDLSKLATFLVRWGDLHHQYLILAHWKIQLNDAELQIGISAKLKQFIVSVKQKIQKVVISSKKAQQNLQEQTVHQLDQIRTRQKWPPGSTPFYRGLLININNIISFWVQFPSSIYWIPRYPNLTEATIEF